MIRLSYILLLALGASSCKEEIVVPRAKEMAKTEEALSGVFNGTFTSTSSTSTKTESAWIEFTGDQYVGSEGPLIGPGLRFPEGGEGTFEDWGDSLRFNHMYAVPGYGDTNLYLSGFYVISYVGDSLSLTKTVGSRTYNYTIKKV